MTRMFALGALLAGLIALAIVYQHGSGPYVVHVPMDNASGLRNGSDVVRGGVRIGKVSLRLGAGDRVIATLEIDADKGPVPRDAHAVVSAVNFLGQKKLELLGGSAARPAPDGYAFPAGSVRTSTDLDQVLAVLDPDTRSRLAILIDQAGTALGGRRGDLAQLLFELPHSMSDGTRLLDELVADNSTLARLVVDSDRLLVDVTRQRAGLGHAVDVLGTTATTVAQRRADLRQALATAPATLRSTDGFLDDLRVLSRPLGPAARDISAAVPPLRSTLAELEPFRTAAVPTLRAARDAAPQLSRLASGATPVLRKATPVVSSLASASRSLAPVTGALDHSIDNVLAVLDNWSRAIELRDGASHLFRGAVTLTPETVRSLVTRLVRLQTPARARRPRPGRREPAGTPSAADPAGDGQGKGPAQPTPAANPIAGLLQGLTGSGGDKPPGTSSAGLKPLLDLLLGP